MLCTLLISCASHDFNVTSFRLTRSDEVYDYFTYKSFADSIFISTNYSGNLVYFKVWPSYPIELSPIPKIFPFKVLNKVWFSPKLIASTRSYWS